MEDSFIDDHCTNCAKKLGTASQKFTKITIVDERECLKILEIEILDAILHVYGFSATNLASAFLDDGTGDLSSFNEVTETSKKIMKHGLSLCNDCVPVFKEVYVAYHQLKQMSNKTSLLAKTIKKFSPTRVKIEVDSDENEWSVGNAEHKNLQKISTKNSKRKVRRSETEGNSTEDLFQTFNFEREYDDYENDQEDIKIDPLAIADTELDSSPPKKITKLVLRKKSSPYDSQRVEPLPKNFDPDLSLMNFDSWSLSLSRPHQAVRTYSRSSNKDKNVNASKSETELKETENCEILPISKKLSFSEEQKEKARLNMRKCMKKRKLIGTKKKKSWHKTKLQSKESGKIEATHKGKKFDQYLKSLPDYPLYQYQEVEVSTDINETKSSTVLKKRDDREKILKCRCGSGFRSLPSLSAHERIHDNEQHDPVMCDICGETFAKNSQLYGHKSKEHSEIPELLLKCNLCDAKYLSKLALKVHQEQKHCSNPNSFTCDKCGNQFNCMRYLNRHISIRHKDEGLDKEIFKCEECGILLKHSYGLKKHMRVMHGTQKTFICPQCGKITKNMTNMRIHMKVHDPNRNVKGKVKSPKSTMEKSDDQLHMQTGES